MTYNTHYFSAAYGQDSYNSQVYNSTGTNNTASTSTSAATTASSTNQSSNTLANTGFELVAAATLGSVIIFSALVVKIWRRPSKKTEA